MDLNYFVGREQVSRHNAVVAASTPARIAYEGMAAAYGRLLAEGGFPRRSTEQPKAGPRPFNDGGRWEDDGGPIETEHAVLVPSKPADTALVWSTPAPAGPSRIKKSWS